MLSEEYMNRKSRKQRGEVSILIILPLVSVDQTINEGREWQAGRAYP